MKTSSLLRMTLALIVLGLTAPVGFCVSDSTVGISGPLTAFRESAWLGWAIKIRNDSDVTYAAVYAINDWADRRIVPPHSTVKAGYVLGREIPSFRFAPGD
jgi:hypothetical protein